MCVAGGWEGVDIKKNKKKQVEHDLHILLHPQRASVQNILDTSAPAPTGTQSTIPDSDRYLVTRRFIHSVNLTCLLCVWHQDMQMKRYGLCKVVPLCASVASNPFPPHYLGRLFSGCQGCIPQITHAPPSSGQQ